MRYKKTYPNAAKHNGICLFYYIGKCSYSSGTPTRIALAILGVQSAGFALFYGIGNCSCSHKGSNQENAL
ncbi:hypothetical protein [Jutongia hominis]|uniref:Uncharacterized protein n=1 Tax=Jutongia hominis TaxID=2763664 RepID=A0ABR7MR04_9FIRM|nr:hypothetical protein [Jutongia hominis]MBC8556227.1 hypothetical protein [Jutongia hominis]